MWRPELLDDQGLVNRETLATLHDAPEPRDRLGKLAREVLAVIFLELGEPVRFGVVLS